MGFPLAPEFARGPGIEVLRKERENRWDRIVFTTGEIFPHNSQTGPGFSLYDPAGVDSSHTLMTKHANQISGASY